MRSLGKADFGATTFCASAFSNDECGANGLPLTPNSISILGRFQLLKSLDCSSLCQYLDMVRCKHERVIVVSEHYKRSFADFVKAGPVDCSHLMKITFEILVGLKYLNDHGIVARNICPQNILLDEKGEVKLTKYGLYHMTVYGQAVSFPIGHPKYSAPEVISQGLKCTVPNSTKIRTDDDDVHGDIPRVCCPDGFKVDIWSIGILIIEALLGGSLWPHLTIQQMIHKVIDLSNSDVHPFDKIVSENGGVGQLKNVPEEMILLIRKCLEINVRTRPVADELLSFPIFKDVLEQKNSKAILNGYNIDMFSTELRSKDLEIPPYDESMKDGIEDEDHLAGRSLLEVYYLWKLAGGDLEATLKRAGLIRSKQPIRNLASFVVDNGELFGQPKDTSLLLDETVVILPQEQLRQRLKSIDPASYYPLLEEENSSSETSSLPHSPSSVDLSETTKLPLVIREKDVEYQFHRIILYDRLLKAYPYKRPYIWKEARIDIPPLVRSYVWAALLEVEGDVYGRYDAIDKETPTPTDRQIAVDVPRCHQYNELFSSSEGHAKFKRILKAWVVSHPEYVYWQGLDSLAAPFLHLNFNNEAVAFACLDAFIPKYLHQFFLKDNSQVIQEYLAVFGHLIAFHDPELSNHLNGIEFIPDLYSIPWFLTMYAHVFPMHKIFHLWDTLLLGNSSFPLCIGVAILQQLRSQLLSFGFNECILLFSDMPEIDMQRCVQDSIKIFCSTPKSATFRKHARPTKRLNGQSENYYNIVEDEIKEMNIPLLELKEEKLPQISGKDLLELCELISSSGSRSPTKRSRSSKPKIIVIDIRSVDDFSRGSIPGSVNIPAHAAFNSDGELNTCPGLTALNQHRQQVKVVVGSHHHQAVQFAEQLLRLGYSKLCILHNCIDAVRSAGVLTIPSPEL